MKKSICVLLAIIISSTFFGCGKTDKNTSSVPAESDLSTNSDLSSETEVSSNSENLSSKNSSKTSSPKQNSQQKPSSSVEKPLQPQSSKPDEVVKVTFPEGTTLPKMFMILDEKGIAKQDALFAEVAKFNTNSYGVTSTITSSSQRCFKLEGYLFPDTYNFFVGEKPTSIINKMVTNSQNRLALLKSEANKTGYTFDQVMILASIIQKETGSTSEQKKVSSVLYNRLKIKMKLQCDPTITYVEGAIKPFITGNINRFNSFYNTYKCAGLPAGPICNPGITAINAALNPAKTDYLYFAMDKNKNHYYAKTLDEHNKNCEKGDINTGIG